MLTLSNYLAVTLFHKGIIPEKDIPIYEYAWQLILSTLLSAIVIIFIGAFTGNIEKSICFLAVFCTLRAFTGGYHAQSYLTCFLCMQLVFLVSLWVVGIVPPQIAAGCTLLLLSAADFILLYLAPSQNQVNPKSEKTMKRNRRRMCYFLLGINALIIIAVLLQRAAVFWLYCSCTLMAVAILVIVNTIQLKLKERM